MEGVVAVGGAAALASGAGAAASGAGVAASSSVDSKNFLSLLETRRY